MHPDTPLSTPRTMQVAGIDVRAERVDTGRINVSVHCDCQPRGRHWHQLTTVSSVDDITPTVARLIT